MAASAARHWPGAAQGSGRGVVVFFWGRAFSCCPERLWWCVPDTYLPSFPGTRIYTRPFGSAGGVVPASCPWLGQAVPMRVHAPIVTPGRSRVPAPAGRARVIHLWLLCVYRYNPPSHPFPPPDLSRGTGAFAIARRPPHPYPRHSLAGCWSRLTAASPHPPPPHTTAHRTPPPPPPRRRSQRNDWLVSPRVGGQDRHRRRSLGIPPFRCCCHCWEKGVGTKALGGSSGCGGASGCGAGASRLPPLHSAAAPLLLFLHRCNGVTAFPHVRLKPVIVLRTHDG